MKKKIRNLKIASVLHRVISRVLMEDEVFNKNIIVSGVKLSKDLRKADVYIVLSSLNVQKYNYDISTVINEMNQSAWSIRKSILCYVDLRFIPELIFRPDLAFDNFVNVNKALHNYT
ncbi:MAG: ribosome-binding factor A [Wolbachia sp.]